MFELKPFLPLIFSVGGVTVLFITFRLKLERDARRTKKNKENFFEREQAAAFARKKEIPDDFYIKVDFSKIPITVHEACDSYYRKVASCKNLKMVHLKGYSNLELKESFGVEHFENLAGFEKNYLTFMDILVKYGSILYENGFIKEAEVTLTQALLYQCDLTKAYILLSEIYLQFQDTKALKDLLETACQNMQGSYYLDKVVHKIEDAIKAIEA